MQKVDRLIPSFVISGKCFEVEASQLVDAFAERIPEHQEALSQALEAGAVLRRTEFGEEPLLPLVDAVKDIGATIRAAVRKEKAFAELKSEAREAKEAEFAQRRLALMADYRRRSDEILSRRVSSPSSSSSDSAGDSAGASVGEGEDDLVI